MRSPPRSILLAAVCFSSLLAPAAPRRALLAADGPDSLDAWMPEDVIACASLHGAGAQLERFLASDARKELESIPLVQLALQKSNFGELQAKLKEFHEATGKEALDLVKDLFGREVVAGARLGFMPEVLVLTRTAGETQIEEAAKALKAIFAKAAGFEAQGTKSEHEGRTIETYDKLSIARLGSVLALSNSQTFIERAIDLAAGKSKASLKASTIFSKAGAGGRDSLLTFAVRPQSIPNFHLPDKADNALVSLLFGGLLAGGERSELLAASLRVDGGNFGLELSSVLDPGALPEKYRGFFPAVESDGLERRLEKRGVLSLVRLHRNLHDWWEHREELLVPRASGQLIEFSNVMSIMFQGRNFQDEVLPEFGPGITLVARNQEYPGLTEKPRPSLPGFAAILELKDAAKFGDSLLSGFQTVVGIINADRAQKKEEGMMAMVLRSEKVGEVELNTVSMGQAKTAKPGMIYNFSPSLAIVADRVILSSSKELAKILIEEISASGQGAAASTAGAGDGSAKGKAKGKTEPDSLVLDVAALGAILGVNRDFLVANSMLDHGKSKEAAEGEMDALFEVIKRVKELRVSSRLEGEAMKLKIRLKTKYGETATAAAGKKGEF